MEISTTRSSSELSVKSHGKEEKLGTISTRTEGTQLQISREQSKSSTRGRIVGGSYAGAHDESGLHNDHGPLIKVDADVPLTLTTLVHQDDREYIVLQFAQGDCENPFNWNSWYKFSITAMLNLMTLTIGLATTSYSSGIASMSVHFGVSIETGELGLFLFNIVCAIAPLSLAPFCELVGRKVVYAGAYLCFTLCFIGLALGKNIETILILRAFLGLFGCVGTILVGGTFDDMYKPRERSGPMAMFSYIAILGTVAAPIYAGYIDESLGWRWIQGIQGLANIPLLVCVFIFFPETRGNAYLRRRARQLRKLTGDERYAAPTDIATPSLKAMLKVSSVKSIQMLVTEPVVFVFGLWIGFTWFVVFLFLSAIPITFTEKREWSVGVSGLPYIGLAIGATLGWLAHHFQMRRYERIANNPNGHVTPETRLHGAMFGAIWLPVGLFLYSFTQYGYLPWIAPTVSLVPIAFGIYFVFESTYSYTADCYMENSSSAIAGQSFLRNTLGAVSPLFAGQLFHGIGSQWAGLMLACVGSVLSMLVFVMARFGPVLRARSSCAM